MAQPAVWFINIRNWFIESIFKLWIQQFGLLWGYLVIIDDVIKVNISGRYNFVTDKTNSSQYSN